MDTSGIRETLKSFLLKQAVKVINVENLRSAFMAFLGPLQDKVKETENQFDDWIMESLVGVFNDDAKMQKLVDFIQSKLTDGMCESACDPAEYEALAIEIGITPGVCEGSIAWLTILAKILETALPIIIDWANSSEP